MTKSSPGRPSQPGITRRGVLAGGEVLGIGAGLDHVLTDGSRGTTSESAQGEGLFA
jgi:hypothetical protein